MINRATHGMKTNFSTTQFLWQISFLFTSTIVNVTTYITSGHIYKRKLCQQKLMHLIQNWV